MTLRSSGILSLSLRAAWRERRLVILLWALHLALALTATVPVAIFLNDAFARFPEADSFLTRFDLPLLFDLLEPNRAATMALGPILGVAAAIALLLNAFAAGGALEVFTFPDRRPLALRFARGGARYFGCFVRMGLAAIPAALAAAALLSAPVWIARGALSFRAEGAKFFLGFAGAALAATGALLVLLALDLARVRVVRQEERRGVRRFFRTLLQVIRSPGALLVLWARLAALLLLAGLLLHSVRSSFTPASTLPLLAMLVVQQLTIAARAFYRVALWSGEIALSEPAGRTGSRIGA